MDDGARGNTGKRGLLVPIALHVGLALAFGLIGFLSPLIYGGGTDSCFRPACSEVDARVIPGAQITIGVLAILFVGSVVVTWAKRSSDARSFVPFGAGLLGLLTVFGVYQWVWAPLG